MLILVTYLGCSGNEEPQDFVAPASAERSTEAGWSQFERGAYAAALSEFSQALEMDASYGPAHVGRAWTQLVMATSAADLEDARTSFVAATTAGETGADVYGGLAATLLALGSPRLTEAISAAQAAYQADPDFRFGHDASFDADDLHFIEAAALAAQGSWVEAMNAVQEVRPHLLDPAEPSSWVVDGRAHASFEAAGLHLLAEVSNAVAR